VFSWQGGTCSDEAAARAGPEWADGTIGELPVPQDELCPFRNRCLFRIGRVCDRQPAPIRWVGTSDHMLVCHRRIEELEVQGKMETAVVGRT
jgi:hypothetical protein